MAWIKGEENSMAITYRTTTIPYRTTTIPVKASFKPVSISGMLGTNTPGVSSTYMLGWFAICVHHFHLHYTYTNIRKIKRII